MKKIVDNKLANNAFFLNGLTFGLEINDILLYLQEIQQFIDNNELLIKVKDKNGELNSLDIYDKKSRGNILRKSIVISIVVLLESHIINYCQELSFYTGVEFNYNEGKGNILEKFKKMMPEFSKFPFNFSGELWSDLCALYEIRNCLVHKNGNLTKFKKKSVIDNFIRKYKNITVKDNNISISYENCVGFIGMVKLFNDEINQIAMNYFPADKVIEYF